MRHADDWLATLAPQRGLTPSQRRIAAAIGATPRQSSYEDLASIAGRAGVDPSTVVRYAQALGFSGWTAFQHELRTVHLASLTLEETLGEHSELATSLVGEALINDIRNLQRAVETVSLEEVQRVVDVLGQARSTLVVATGSSIAPAVVLAHLGVTLGYPMILEQRGSSSLAAQVSRLGADDAIVVVSLWRPQRDVTSCMEAARSRGAAVIAICDLATGPVANRADHALIVPSEGVSFVQSVTAATSLVYGLIAALEARDVERARIALRETQRVWDQMDVYHDPRQHAAS